VRPLAAAFSPSFPKKPISDRAATPPGTGVSGRGDAYGVWGMSEKIGVSGIGLEGSDEEGKHLSGIGVAGFSLQNRAGVFTGIGIADSGIPDKEIADTMKSLELDPQQHPAQVRMVPYPPFDDQNKPQKLPKNGLAGDFFVVHGGGNLEAIVWFCIRSHRDPDPSIPGDPGDPGEWGMIQLTHMRDGGTSALLP